MTGVQTCALPILKEIDQPVEDEVQKAAIFLYLITGSFGSQVGGGWGYAKTRKPKNFHDLDVIRNVQDRLQSVLIDNRSFEKVITAFDSKDTLFYLDPPYWINGQKFYQYEFLSADHERLNELLKGIQGRFVLSYNDCPAIRSMYRGFTVKRTKEVHYSMNNKRDKSRQKRELLITNF